jgi:hypothetical protein
MRRFYWKDVSDNMKVSYFQTSRKTVKAHEKHASAKVEKNLVPLQSKIHSFAK